MKTIFLIGNDFNKIDKRLTELINSAHKKNYQIITVTDENPLVETLKNNDLFQEKKLVIIPRLSILSKSDFDYLKIKGVDEKTVLIVKNENSVPVTKLKYFGNDTKVENYNLPKIIWNFLDSLKKGNSKKSLILLNSLLDSEPIELVFYLISQRFIQLYMAKVKPSELKISSWQVTKMQNQAEEFEKEELRELINKLADIDVKSKTGVADLRILIDLFLATKLE